jgi:hypothetical protein
VLLPRLAPEFNRRPHPGSTAAQASLAPIQPALDVSSIFDQGRLMEELDTLLAHARALVGVELGELADALGLPVPVGQVRTKGWSGQVIEHELGVALGGARGPDFAALGIELKTVPVRPSAAGDLDGRARSGSRSSRPRSVRSIRSPSRASPGSRATFARS